MTIIVCFHCVFLLVNESAQGAASHTTSIIFTICHSIRNTSLLLRITDILPLARSEDPVCLSGSNHQAYISNQKREIPLSNSAFLTASHYHLKRYPTGFLLIAVCLKPGCSTPIHCQLFPTTLGTGSISGKKIAMSLQSISSDLPPDTDVD